MDSNYEAQRHLANQRLAAQREQGMTEQLIKKGQPQAASVFRQLLKRLFYRPVLKRTSQPIQQARVNRPVVKGRG